MGQGNQKCFDLCSGKVGSRLTQTAHSRVFNDTAQMFQRFDVSGLTLTGSNTIQDLISPSVLSSAARAVPLLPQPPTEAEPN